MEPVDGSSSESNCMLSRSQSRDVGFRVNDLANAVGDFAGEVPRAHERASVRSAIEPEYLLGSDIKSTSHVLMS